MKDCGLSFKLLSAKEKSNIFEKAFCFIVSLERLKNGCFLQKLGGVICTVTTRILVNGDLKVKQKKEIYLCINTNGSIQVNGR